MKKMLSLLVFGAAAMNLNLNLAHAHGDALPEHGGIVQVVNEIVVELVVRGDQTDVYLRDDDDPLPTAGMTGKLTVMASGAKSEMALKPAGGNKLEAKGTTLASGAKVIALLQLGDKKPKLSASFTIK